MMNEVLVTIRGQQRTREEEGEVIEVIVPGHYQLRDGCHYLTYEEMLDDSDAITKTLVKFTPAQMEMVRKGHINSRMIFAPGKETVTDYRTPFGDITAEITTFDLSVEAQEEKIDLQLRYSMLLGGAFAQDSTVEMEIRPARPEIHL